MPMTRSFCTLLLLAGIGGCSGPREIVEGTPYPATLKHSGAVDIQVFRKKTQIELTNTTARSYGPSTLWLNRRFSLPIEGFAVGQTLRFELKQFTDEFGDTFRGGGFFATRRPDRLGLAELQIGDQMVGFIVVGEVED
jgi:hypothetical protein